MQNKIRVIFVEREHLQPYYRVFMVDDNQQKCDLVYQSVSRKRAYDFFLKVCEAVKKEEKDETREQV